MTQNKQVSFHTTKQDAVLIGKIINRAMNLGIRMGDTLSTHMDISAVIAQGCPLKLQEWLDAPDFDFVHDFCGITRHIDRKTGELQDFFLPRFAQPVSADKSAS
jgi:hypothetical protein